MAGAVKGPAIFLAQFAGDAAPFNSFDGMCKWAASLGYKGVQIPALGTTVCSASPRRAPPRHIATRSRDREESRPRRNHNTKFEIHRLAAIVGYATNKFPFGRTPRLQATPAYLPTCDVRGRDLQRQLNVDSGRFREPLEHDVDDGLSQEP